MKQQINTNIAVAYSHCPRKTFLLLSNAKAGKPHEYVEILAKKQHSAQTAYLEKLNQKKKDTHPYDIRGLDSKASLITEAMLHTEMFQADCGLLTKVATHSKFGHYSYEPTIFVGTHTIGKEDKLTLFFTAHVLEQVQQKSPAKGAIINAEGKTHKVKLDESAKTLLPVLEPLKEWLDAWAKGDKPEEPKVILNKHCPLCQFRDACRAKAVQEDNLSLLDRMTPKAMRKLERKGIFTVTQLSYTFRPRKRKKRAKNPPPVTHKLELQALAIREKKIYIQELPEIKRKPVEIFLDIEGIPDQNVYYLIGLLVCEGETSTHHSFWADELTDESKIWQQFVKKANEYPDAPIYHYGNYEVRALKKLANRYETDAEAIIKRLVNVNGFIYGKVYFPTYSNRLKDLGQFIGAEWSSEEASGLQSLVWREHWDEKAAAGLQQVLLKYNQEDCVVLKLLIDGLTKINGSADVLSEVDFVNQPKKYETEVGKQIHCQFEEVLKFAHMNYDEKKISFQPEADKTKTQRRKPGRQKGYRQARNEALKIDKTIEVPPMKTCPNPKHKDELLQVVDTVVEQIVVDLVLTKNGIKKIITKYKGNKARCPKCYYNFSPPELVKLNNVSYGYGFKSWIVYHRVAMRLPYGIIADALEEQFHEKLLEQTIPLFVKGFAKRYAETEKNIIQRLLESPFLHVDETPINIKGLNQYVWVFTDGKYIIFRLAESREATILHSLLQNYYGIIISDFYSGYDSLHCQQQKCWVHLIRVLNDDLWASPFDREFESFISEVRNLIIPIMITVQKYGLKKRFLNKHKKQIDKFYENTIMNRHYKSDLVVRYQKRFIRYRVSLFTFLEGDGIPWNNNMAERALRHLTKQQQISQHFRESTTHSYLVLLGIRQTCRFQGKSFFKFLFSGETDLDEFQKSKRSRRTPK